MSPRSRDGHDLSEDGTEPPAKVRRTSRACIQCRIRKQRCDGPSQTDPMLPCRRCCQLGATCSFATTPVENEGECGTIATTVHRVSKIQKEMLDHQKRILQLEHCLRELKDNRGVFAKTPEQHSRTRSHSDVNRSCTTRLLPELSSQTNDYDGILPLSNVTAPDVPPETFHNNPSLFNSALPSPPQTDRAFTMNTVNLDTPMSTLRNLKTLSTESDVPSPASRSVAYDPILPITSRKDRERQEQDPVIQGILSAEEAEQAFEVFFSHCHQHAPFLCVQSQRSASFVRETSPTLFLSVCTVGARFWQTANSQANYQGLHEGYPKLVALLDKSISRLLLHPSPMDVNLDHIRALLLYIQWMPVESKGSGICHTRYNDISAWGVLGLAIRYAIFLGLDRTAVVPFSPEYIEPPSPDDFARLRVWINLLTCDCHLMLSAGLPASLDPEPFAKLARAFASHRDSIQPEDSRIAAICELVGIVKQAAKASGDPSVRNLDAATLKRVNSEFDAWELYWTPALTCKYPVEFQHSQIPFTSYRWYRLAINSACLGVVLSSSKNPQAPMQLSLLQALDNSLLAAAQTILALSSETNLQLWPTQCQEVSSFPPNQLTINEAAVGRFRFAVDSAWVTHSFAAVFLVLCYTRGVIDDELQILYLAAASNCYTVAPAPPRPTSIFFRLISLASQIFDTICRTSVAHPAADYRTIINNVFSVILTGEREDMSFGVGENMSMDGLFEMMLDAGFNWQGALFRDDSGDIQGL